MNIYQNKLVAFIDILGFSNLVKDSAENGQKAELLLSLLKDIEAFIKKEEDILHTSERIGNITAANLKVNYTQFSDSIILSTDIVVPEIHGIKAPNINNFMMIFSILSYLQAKFLNEGILLRGGLTWGPLFHEKNICFGPAFIRAYSLESRLAVNPRIVIDPCITTLDVIPTEYEDYDSYPYLMEKNLKGFMFLKDEEDGNYFINFMALQTFKANAHSILEKVKENIKGMSEEDEDEKKIISKHQWLIREINNFLKGR
ncbi:hypothetical protein [Paenibacillus sp. BR1-192]|uniref:hypothetical protein n=1 Tax=Paenibacillus sp. BR1-192 TaxID=3032287 RepID=UPI00240E1678|nr:hypothetical protein [Paenibacillus sp. BR1-192]WFB61179.1 hypothetical protein P0X86_13620 [Paenibacillus sp. BR1-192]